MDLILKNAGCVYIIMENSAGSKFRKTDLKHLSGTNTIIPFVFSVADNAKGIYPF